MNRENREIWIGAATVASFVMILGFMNQGLQAVSKAETSRTSVIGKFNKVDGLVAGSDVRMSGIKVGRVAAMQLDDRFRAVVTMDLDPEFRFPRDTSAAIHTDGLFGGKFVVLEPGAEEKSMRTGDEFVLTQDAVIVSDLLDLIISEGKVAQARRSGSAN